MLHRNGRQFVFLPVLARTEADVSQSQYTRWSGARLALNQSSDEKNAYRADDETNDRTTDHTTRLRTVGVLNFLVDLVNGDNERSISVHRDVLNDVDGRYAAVRIELMKVLSLF